MVHERMARCERQVIQGRVGPSKGFADGLFLDTGTRCTLPEEGDVSGSGQDREGSSSALPPPTSDCRRGIHRRGQEYQSAGCVEGSQDESSGSLAEAPVPRACGCSKRRKGFSLFP